MNILVLNGSPKTKQSTTLQTLRYLEQRNSNLHSFAFAHITPISRADQEAFVKVKQQIHEAELIVFSYPVYTFLLPYQLQRFIELLYQEGISLKGKYVTQFSTSKHFYDMTAHKYLEENALDLEAYYLQGLSADMEDLLEEKGQKEADAFFDKLIFDISIGKVMQKPKKETIPLVTPFQESGDKVEVTGDKKVVVVTNCQCQDQSLSAMITEFIAVCPHSVVIANVREFGFKGGCIGCLQCAVTGDCFYKDGFQDYLRKDIQTADAIIYAFSIEHHYTHSSMKCYDDRQFCNGHRSVTHGMPVGYLISGNYKEEFNLQTLVEARSEVGQVYLTGVVTDEAEVNTASEIKKLALSLDYLLKHPMSKPANFYGVGGTKIFRDMVYLMQGMMKADHLYYKEHGIYDFPHNNKKKMLQMKVIGGLLNLPSVQKKMKGGLGQFIIVPYEKVVEGAVVKNGSSSVAPCPKK